MAKKKQLRIRNWKDYNSALVNRGSLTVWFDKNSIDAWHNTYKSGGRGRPQLYSDIAIQCCLTLKTVFHLPLRATEGFVNSLLELLQLPLSAPDYSSLSIRQKSLSIQLPKSNSQNLHLVVDSTGLKLYGEGEWKIRTHGKDKKRSWLKLHLGINEKTHDIEACMLTADNVHDCEAFPDLLNQIAEGVLAQVTGDGAYDTHDVYSVTLEKGAKPCFPPRSTASRHKPTDQAWIARNKAVSHVIYKGMENWKEKNNYHRRSIAETAMFRFKTLLGTRVNARTMERQANEIALKCYVINKINKLGMPITQAC